MVQFYIELRLEPIVWTLNERNSMDQNVFAEQLKIAMDAAGMKQADLIHAAQEEGHKLWKSQVSQ